MSEFIFEDCLTEFEVTSGNIPPEAMGFADEDTRALRRTLLLEEVREYLEAEENDDLENCFKELCDILYIVFGTAFHYGLPITSGFKEVHKSNMSKFENGEPVFREDGKILKGKDYFPADMAKVMFFWTYALEHAAEIDAFYTKVKANGFDEAKAVELLADKINEAYDRSK